MADIPTTSAAATVPRALSTRVPTQAPPAVAGGIVFALLANNELVAVRLRDGGLVAQRSLAPVPDGGTYRGTGHFLAFSKDGTRLFALVGDEGGSAPRVVVLHTETVAVQATYLLHHGVTFRGIVVGPLTGRLYLFGDQNKSALVTVLDPASGREMAQWTARAGGPFHWEVYQGAVSSDERQLFISYHGQDTGGIDRFEIAKDGLQRCPGPYSNSGCIPTHGGFTPYHDGFLAATGTNVVLDVAMNGTIRQGFDTQLKGNHLMDFVVRAATDQLYAVGSCGYVPGFSVLDLATGGGPVRPAEDGEWQWPAGPKPPRTLRVSSGRDRDALPCGERLTLGPDSLLVVGKTTKPVATSDIPGALLILDVRTGQVLRTVPTPSEPIDVLATGLP